jgi:hypothetical protein
MTIAKPSNHVAEPETVTIATGQTASARVNMAGRQPVGVYCPAEMDVAAITFEVAYDIGGTLFNVHDNAEAVYDIAVPVVGAYMQIDPQLFRGGREMVMTIGTAQLTTDTDFVVMFAEPDKNF